VGWTKRQFIEAAFEEIGYASYTFDLQPEQLEAAMRRLDSMMATWNGKGIRLGYPIPSIPENSNLADESGVPDSANEAIYTNLAIRIAPTVGKSIPPETREAAKRAYNVLLARATMPPEKQLPGGMPAGAGNKPWVYDSPFLDDPEDNLSAGPDSNIEFN